MPANNREEWLQQMVEELRPYFTEAGVTLLEKIHVSCGWPSKRATSKKQATGQCFSRRMSTGEFNEIFISPIKSDGIEVAAILTHELIHAADDCLNAHKDKFIQYAKAVGLQKPWTETHPTERLVTVLESAIKKIGKYPHPAIDISAFDKLPKQTTRLVKVACPDSECGVVVRMTRVYIEADKIPTCACGLKMEVAA
jgi:hypothetical protein